MSRLPCIAATVAVLALPSIVSTGLLSIGGLSEAEKFRLREVRPVLRSFGDHSCELETLLVATAAHESHLGRLSKNVFQITEIAADELRSSADGDRFDEPIDRWSTFTSVAAAAFTYKRNREAIPSTAREAAFFWKRVYNTPAGKGTVRKFLKDAEREGVEWCRRS